MKTTTLVQSERAATQAPSRWRVHLAALGGYAILAIIATFPLALRLGEGVIANEPGSVDAYLGIWNIWWTARALSAGQNPYFTLLLFHPQGLDLFWQTLSLPQGLLVLPVTLLAGPLVAYNLLIIVGFALGGYFTFLFVSYVLTADSTSVQRPASSVQRPASSVHLAAFVAGAVYALAPFHMQKVFDAQLEVASVQWVPLCLLAVHLLLERRRWPYLLLAGLALLWVGLGTWYYGLFCLIYTAMAAALWALNGPNWRERLVRLGWGLAPLALWLALMAPRLLQLLQIGDRYLGDASVFNDRSAADLIAFFLPSPLHPLWGAAITRYHTGLYPDAMLWNVSMGLVGCLLAIAGIVIFRRATWRWLLLALITALLAMGEQLKLFGWRTGLPLPYALLADLPGIRSSHRPNHFVILTIMMLALLAGYGTLALLRRVPRRAGSLAVGLVGAVFLVDGLALPLPFFSRPVPAPYISLGAPPPDGGALLPLPPHLNFSNSEHLWYQTVHGRPIIGGFIGREPPYPTGLYYPGIRELRSGVREPDDILTYGWPALAREGLAALDIRYIMLHRSAGSQRPLMRELLAEMGLERSYGDELIEVYPLPVPEQLQPLLYLGAGWGDLEREGARRWRWMEERTELRLFNPLATAHPVVLDLAMESFQQPRRLELALNGNPAGSLEVSRAAMRRSLRLLLPPGEHVLYLSAQAEPVPGHEGRRLSIAFLEIGLRP